MLGRNEDMEHFKMTIRRRTLALLMFVLAAAAFETIQVFWPTHSLGNDPMFKFEEGFLCGILVLASLQIIRYKKVVKDEKALRVQYNKENDERRRAIRAKAGIPFLAITSVAMIVAANIAGYFNLICFYTLMIAAVCQIVLALILKQIYSHKM